MNVEKSEIKMLVAKELGKKLSEMKEAAGKDLHRNEGAAGALKQGFEKLEVHKGFYKKELMEDQISPEEHAQIMTVIARCQGILTNLSDAAVISKFIKQGEVLAYSKSNSIISSIHESERSKLEELYRAIENGEVVLEDGTVRPESVSQGNSVLDDLNQRRIDAAAKKNVDKDIPKKEVIEKAAPKKRGRKKKVVTV